MNYFQMIMALIGVLALVFVIFWVMKKFNARVTLTDSRHLKVLERVNLGPDKMLLIVSVCGKCMLLGVTSQSTEKICDLDETEEQLVAKQADRQTFPTFTESFKSILGKKKAEKANLDNGENNLKVTFDTVKADENKNSQDNQENVGDIVKNDEKSNQNDSENYENQE